MEIMFLTVGIDNIKLNFSQNSLILLNIILGFVMFGVALEIKVGDFKRVLKTPKPFIIGLLAQFLILPALTYLLILLIKPQPSVALGMMLIAACPGGNISNFFCHWGKGNTALSVSMTALSTTFSMFMTPFNISFWGSMYEPTNQILKTVSVDPVDMAISVALLLGVPLALGMFIHAKYERLAGKVTKFFKVFSIVFFLGFIVAALAANFKYFIDYIGVVAIAVFLQNAVALSSAYFFAKLWKINSYDARAVSIEVGIQNSGLGLVLIFNFFDGLGGMAVIAAWWGIWHMVSGISLSTLWRRNPPENYTALHEQTQDS